jgi:hypothetical protein
VRGPTVLIVLENISSEELMDGALPLCPVCGGRLEPMHWRAGPAAFVAAAACPTCHCLVRANDAFSIEPEPAPRWRVIE